MDLRELGYTDELERYRAENGLGSFSVGRVAAEHRERYVVKTAAGETDAEITGNLRYAAGGRQDFPAVGDWVALSEFGDGFAVIHAVFPRRTVITRQAPGGKGEVQLIAANVDFAFLTQAADRDFSVNRLERYLAICRSAGVEPIVVLTKADLVDADGLDRMIKAVQSRIEGVPVLAVSNVSGSGLAALSATIERGKTYCLLGSSGVGKSTLTNALAGTDSMKTDAISVSTGKGRHVTSHRELFAIPGGGILIDNPGMREVGIADEGDGLSLAFDEIAALAKQCRFSNCTHSGEAGCAIAAALERGEINGARVENYRKTEREKAHYEATVAERRKKDRDFGKMVRRVNKERNG